MNLTIDIGNTRAKIIVFDNNSNPIYEEVLSEDLKHAVHRISAKFQLQRCIWCNVGGHDETVEKALETLACPVLHFTGQTNVPVNVCYKSRNTLGADRLAAVVGATQLCPDTDLLIIDAGTCITYDLVDALGNYLGGNISPGMEMRFKALHHYTACLPEVSEEGDLPEIGINTETAIRCGVVKGLTYEIEGYINRLKQSYPQMRIFLTGGSQLDFSNLLKSELLSDPYLVARGLNLTGQSADLDRK